MGTLTMITGDAGSGKSTLLSKEIEKDVAAGTRSYLIVPEQETVWRERELTELLPPSYPLCFEVTNFTRLSDTVSRSLGKITYNKASSGARALIMWHTLAELEPFLSERRGGVGDYGRVSKMLAAVKELSASRITPTELTDAASRLPEGSSLASRMRDLALVTTAYNSFFEERFPDGGDELIKLISLLDGGSFFDGAKVYIDGFTSFTQAQRDIISRMTRECDVTVTLPLPDGREDEDCFAEVLDTEARLIRDAMKSGIKPDLISAGESKRTKSNMINFAATRLWGVGEAQKYTEDLDGSLRIIEADDAYDEAEFIAADIARRVRDGCMYRDFAIVAGDAGKYDGIIDSVLDTHSIPHFVSTPTDVATYRPIKLICSAYAAICGGFARRDLMTYVKCGLLGIPEEEIDEFENFAERWNIFGRRFTDGRDWNMHPDGYREELSDESIAKLTRINETRKRICEPLIAFHEECRGKHTVREHSTALYRFLVSLSLEERLAESAEVSRADGDLMMADAEERLWGIICSALDKITEVLPDLTLAPDEYLVLLKLMFGEESISSIPTSCDEVTIGSAATLRANKPRHVYLIGVSDGSFPALPVGGRYFSSDEVKRLSEIGLEIGDDGTISGARELFHFYRAFRYASESVTLTAPTLDTQMKQTEASGIIKRLKAMFGDGIIKKTSNLSPLDRVWQDTDVPTAIASLKSKETVDALLEKIKDNEGLGYIAEMPDKPLKNDNASASDGVICDMSGRRTLSLSQSKIDSYAKCPFSYFCKYVLKLSDGKKYDFNFADMGNFSHAVMERLLVTTKELGCDFGSLTDEMLFELIDRITKSYLSAILRDDTLLTPRREHLFRRLTASVREAAKYMRDEFAQSEFTPEFFEFGMGMGDGGMRAREFALDGDYKITLRGKIDRIDVFRRDGAAYLRVVDYKSSVHTFNADDLAKGLNVQLIVYLLAVTGKDSPIPKLIGADEVIPAGAMYMSITPKRVVMSPEDGHGEFESRLRQGFVSTGVFLEDTEVLRAMDRELAGAYIPISTKNGVFDARSIKSLATLEKMGEYMSTVEGAVRRIGEDIKRGRVKANPHTEGQNSPCKYCSMQSVCRSALK